MDVSTCFSLAARCQHLKHVVVHTQSKARCKSASTKTENPTMMSFALPSMVDETSGTHHFTLASPLEIEPGGDASTIVEAYADGRIILRGRGSALGESTKTSDGGGSEIDKSQSETIVTVGNHKPNSSSC
eukprot:TRINITY_DN39030_c1_g3_i1.p1 TRINITY_DN39030_c1_g3~~TRINITY_DN39030_c1_g3_i1.p1  ORF type:complete len:143 (+),score=18.50 TRINITY_DN39030_c1_g3_i1:42-431(+)